MSYKYLNKWLEEKDLKTFPSKLRLLLIDNESLTKRLEGLTRKRLSIKIIEQRNFYISEEKPQKLSNTFKGYAVHRRVLLDCEKFETIKAESFFPLKYLSGKEKFLALLGEKSLGTYILKPNRFKRFITKFQITSKYACRTIIYKYKTKHILVKEYFPVCMSMDSLTLLKCRRQV
tara:strand:+ start:29 stop:553 length:525 start_codon:yes stop_codon:yes gene_type:complete